MYQNRVSIIGYVGNDAQLRSTKTGAPVAVFSVATKSSWKNASGGYDSRTEWHRCVAWGSLSQFAAKLEKGAHLSSPFDNAEVDRPICMIRLAFRRRTGLAG